MLCIQPIEVGSALRPCGQCMNCRINHKRKWTSRILMESMFHKRSIFVTLTYNDKTVPLDEDGQPTLVPKHLRNWLKRLRKAHQHIGPVRFFGVGEYGDKTQRPHYHAILFGVDLDAEQMICDTWNNQDEPRGFISISELTSERAAYTAQYTTKKMTRDGDIRLGRRHPEFARMSTNKGIGFPAVNWLATTIRRRGLEMVRTIGDIPNTVRIEGKLWPLSEYIRRNVRARLGLSNDLWERAIQLEHVDNQTGEITPKRVLSDTYTFPGDMEELLNNFGGVNPLLPLQEKTHRQKVIIACSAAAAQTRKLTRQGRAKNVNKIGRI